MFISYLDTGKEYGIIPVPVHLFLKGTGHIDSLAWAWPVHAFYPLLSSHGAGQYLQEHDFQSLTFFNHFNKSAGWERDRACRYQARQSHGLIVGPLIGGH